MLFGPPMQTLSRSLVLALSLSQCAIAKRPNILFIISDDQDNHMGSLEHMPRLQKYMIDEGTTFENHFCTVGNASRIRKKVFIHHAKIQ